MDSRVLCLRYLMGDASPEEVSALSAWIVASPENAQVFALLAAQDAYFAVAVANQCKPRGQDSLLLEELSALERDAGPAQLVDLTDRVEERERLEKQQKRAARKNKQDNHPQRATRKQQVVLTIPKAAVWVGLAAAVALAASLLFYLSEPNRDQNRAASSPDSEQATPAPPPVFAAVVRSLDAQWKGDEDLSDYLRQGRHTLTQGMVELELLSGTRVVVESPATFVLTDINMMDMLDGRAVVDVPKASTGFILDTPSARFVETGGQYSFDHGAATGVVRVSTLQTTRNTEFGVFVYGDTQTKVQVYRGEIQATTLHNREAISEPVTLVETQSALIAAGVPPKTIDFDQLAFKREITTELDLADLVMGGDGTTGRKNVGLHLLTGQYTRQVAGNQALVGLISTGRPQPVPASPYVTGVFIPSKDGQLSGLPIGLTLPNLPETNGIGYGVIWSGAMMPSVTAQYDTSIPAKLPGYNFVGAGQPAMVMHTNAGLIIDLDAIRSQYPGFEVVSFQAVVGNASGRTEDEAADASRSEFLVYLDSDPAMRSTFVRSAPDDERVAKIDLSLYASNRYLTLVSTDGGDNNHQDWIVLGDPTVVLQPLENLTPDF
ncbi:MAG: NPCBM/NEW2 domain-containing protein [Phycisphaeraceae bacterium]|nr:NPCBM/NEW2 domain-containing protein [Phycisphaeraceae bacterium]